MRDRTHVAELLRLDVESDDKEAAVDKAADVILKDLKRIYENAIKPLEQLYKYRDLSNRHFSDPEIFSKPLVLFMGPWSGGKSTILNYLTDNEYTPNSLRTGRAVCVDNFETLTDDSDVCYRSGTITSIF